MRRACRCWPQDPGMNTGSVKHDMAHPNHCITYTSWNWQCVERAALWAEPEKCSSWLSQLGHHTLYIYQCILWVLDGYIMTRTNTCVHSSAASSIQAGLHALHTAPGRNSGFHLECSMLGLYVVWQDEMPYCFLSTWNTGSDKHDIAPLA